MSRFVSIWFQRLTPDWFVRKHPKLQDIPFVISTKDRSRLIVTDLNMVAAHAGVRKGMVLADARSLEPSIEVFEEKAGMNDKLLEVMAEWAIRYSPVVALDPPEGLLLDVTGCAHLWGGERPFLKDIVTRLHSYGYSGRAALSDTIGTSWAVARYGKVQPIILPSEQKNALRLLPPEGLRIDQDICALLKKLGIYKIGDLFTFPRSSLPRAFGKKVLLRLDQALGEIIEPIKPRRPVEPYAEKFVCAEGIASAEGIYSAIEMLTRKILERLCREQKGVKKFRLECLRLDGEIQSVEIGFGSPSLNLKHILKVFEEKLPTIEPALGIEIFSLTATQSNTIDTTQREIFNSNAIENRAEIAELTDRLESKFGKQAVGRFIPIEDHWPERSIKFSATPGNHEQPSWTGDKIRPITILEKPQPIEVTAPVPDYPPLFFRLGGKIHRILKADGPERIERAWWKDRGPSRDYYSVEDEAGKRYWIFRSGHYTSDEPSRWFLHGFFA